MDTHFANMRSLIQVLVFTSLVPGEIDGLLVPSSKAYKLLTDYLITDKLLKRSGPAQEKWFKSNCPYI